jgi:phosphomannomutase
MPTDPSSFFKAYDIRGTYPDIDSRIYYWTGYALVSIILAPENLSTTVNIMHDIRYTSEEFYSALAQGIKAAGGEVISLGLGSTDLLYAACQQTDLAGVMVTASHNPKDDNGIKIVKQHPQMLGLGTGLEKIRDFVLEKLKKEPDFKPTQSSLEYNVDAKQQLLDFYNKKLRSVGNVDEVNQILKNRAKKLKIVVDCGNAMGGFVMPFVEELYDGQIEFVKLFWELDGDFPNHQADPLNFDTLKSLQAKILETQADLGVAIDGDGDRIFFLDAQANIMKGDETVAILARNCLEKYFLNSKSSGNPVILFDQRSRSVVPKTIVESAGVAVPTKVGHTNFKQNMIKYDAQYGGEVSGHHYFRDFGFMDSAAMTLVSFIEVFAKNPESLLDFHQKIQKQYYTTQGEINFHLRPELSFDKVKTLILTAFPDLNFNLMDGLTIYAIDWQANIRMSNTEPLLRLNLETIGENRVNEKVEQIKQILGL